MNQKYLSQTRDMHALGREIVSAHKEDFDRLKAAERASWVSSGRKAVSGHYEAHRKVAEAEHVRLAGERAEHAAD